MSLFRPRSVLAVVGIFVALSVPTSALATSSVNVMLKSFSITLSDITISKGTVKFKAKNSSGTTHAFCVKGKGINKCTSTFSSGSRTLKVSLKKGNYTTYCPVGDHEDAGMKKTLKVS